MGESTIITAIVLNYNTIELTVKCVQEIIRTANLDSVSCEVVVVDNSATNSGTILRSLLPPMVRMLPNMTNLGFAAGCNQGISVSSGEFIALVNSDAEISEGFFETCLEYFESHPNVGVWAPRIVNPHGHVQVSASKLPSIRWAVKEYILGNSTLDYPMEGNEVIPVEAISGACIIVRKEVFRDVGLFDERFFFTMEDMDFSKRIEQSKWSIAYDLRASVQHVGGASKENSWINHPYLHKYRALYFKKHYGTASEILVLIIIWLGLTARRGKRFFQRKKLAG